MLREFAVEPALLSDWHTFRYLHEKFGISKARVIAEFPNKWLSMVRKNISYAQQARLEEWIKKDKKTFLIPHKRDKYEYTHDKDWLQNAESAHETKQFNSILARDNPRNHDKVLKWSEEEYPENHGLFKSEYEFEIPKTTEGFLQTCELLLQNSCNIIFVDPYLNDNHYDVLKALFYCIISTNNNANIRYITGESTTDKSIEYIVDKLEKATPSGMSIRIIVLKKKENAGLDTHNRYILTERGGIKFPWGLDKRDDKASDTVNYLSEKTHREKFDEYDELKRYSIAAKFTVEGKG
jgi:hypothetical protein